MRSRALERDMMRSVALACLLLVACSPVLLYGDQEPHGQAVPPPDTDAAAASVAGAGAAALVPTSATAAPNASIAVKPTDCGRCFELVASGTGGVPPYRYQWDDGSQNARRRVCTDQKGLLLALIVEDSAAARSSALITRLEADPDAGCAPAPAAATKLCIQNPSFEGTPAANLGNPGNFD